jgi:hypothetical protein
MRACLAASWPGVLEVQGLDSRVKPVTSASWSAPVRRRWRGWAPGWFLTGGGLTLPWGVAVDGNDTVWVANFGFPFDLARPEGAAAWDAPNRVSHFCGVDTSKCPPTKRGVGKAISPDGTGYTSDALDRNTGIAVDPSGNVWLANNWKPTPLLNNPGGNSIAGLVGAAAPLDTPLIGTPRAFERPAAGATTWRHCQLIEADTVIRQTGMRIRPSLLLRQPVPYP